MLADRIVRRIFESPPQRGFARHLLCAVGDHLERLPLRDCDSRALLRALARWRWQLPSSVYHHEQLPRPLHLISSSPLRLRHHLEEHLLASVLDWSCDTFWDNSVKAQRRDVIAFSSLAMLQIIAQCATSAQLFLVSTASPLLVYGLIGVKMFSSGVFSVAAYRRFLQARGQAQAVSYGFPAFGSRDIVALFVLTSRQSLFTPSNPLNRCLTLCPDAAQIPQFLHNPPVSDDNIWQRRDEDDIIDMAAELLD